MNVRNEAGQHGRATEMLFAIVGRLCAAKALLDLKLANISGDNKRFFFFNVFFFQVC